MADVAKVSGVSHQTVSRVLNDHPSVRFETRRRVLDAIDNLGYRGNLTARALVTRNSRTLGVVCFDTTLYGPASMLYEIEQAVLGGEVLHMSAAEFLAGGASESERGRSSAGRVLADRGALPVTVSHLTATASARRKRQESSDVNGRHP
jgi:transcriptional regulator with XRE-family HTH domain